MDVINSARARGRPDLTVVGGRYGLASKDTPPSSCSPSTRSWRRTRRRASSPWASSDDVTNLSLPEDPNSPNTAAEGTIELQVLGLGGDGTVGANKNSIKIIGDHTDKYVQAYFSTTRKTGGVTISHLRFGDSPIRSTYYVNKRLSWLATTPPTSPGLPLW